MRFKEYLTEIQTGSKSNPSLDAFMKEFWAETFPNPIDHRMRVWGSEENAVGIKAVPFDGKIQLDTIISFIAKNSGNASKALKWFCELADKHGVMVGLYVKPIPNAGAREGKNLTKTELKNWYARYGFEKAAQADTMIREQKELKEELRESAHFLSLLKAVENFNRQVNGRLREISYIHMTHCLILYVVRKWASNNVGAIADSFAGLYDGGVHESDAGKDKNGNKLNRYRIELKNSLVDDELTRLMQAFKEDIL